MIPNRLEIIIFSAFFAFNCGDVYAEKLSTVSPASPPVASIFSLGGTYDSMSQHPTKIQSCLKAASLADSEITSPAAHFNFREIQDQRMVQQALGVELAAEVGYGPFSVDSSYSYAQSSQDDHYTLNLNYIYQYSGKKGFKRNTVIQGKDALTSEAIAVLGSGEKFRQMCGDSVIAQLDAGVSLLIRLSLSFDSEMEKNYFSDSILRLDGLQNVLQVIKENPNHVHFKLNAAGIQIGGQAELLTQLFIQSGGVIGTEGYPILDCGDEKSNNLICSNFVNQVISYSQTLSTQLTTESNFYLINPTVATWRDLGVDVDPVEVDPDIRQAMQEIAEQYNQDRRDVLFLSEYRNMLVSKALLSSDMQKNLDGLLGRYQLVMNLYHDPNLKIMNCFNGFIESDCLLIRAQLINLRNSILNDKSLNQLLIYLRTRQYSGRFFYDPDIQSTVLCMLLPIGGNETHLYMINCNGQVTGDLNPATGISLDPKSGDSSLSINNLTYHYVFNGVDSSFYYQFNQPLQADAYYLDAFAGIAKIKGLDKNILEMKNVMVTKIN